MAETLCMPPLLVAILTLLSSDIEGTTSRLTVVDWRRGEAPLLRRPIRRRAFQEYGGHQTGTAGGSCLPAGQQAQIDPDWSNLRPLRMRITTKRGRAVRVQVGSAEA